MANTDKIKIQINMNADMVRKIDAFAKSIGMNRSSICQYWIGQGYRQQETQSNMFENMSQAISNDIKRALSEQE